MISIMITERGQRKEKRKMREIRKNV